MHCKDRRVRHCRNSLVKIQPQAQHREKCKSCTKKPYSRVIFFFAVNACNFFFAVSRVNYKKKLNFLIFAVSRVIFFLR